MRRLLLPALLVLLLVGAVACEPTAAVNPTRTPKEFGASTSPWDVDDWAKSVGAKPTALLLFEQFSLNRNLDKQFTEARRQHLRSIMVSWEPWTPVDASRGKAAQYAVQSQWTNKTIADGKHDAYLKLFAQSVKRSGIKVWIRYAHEMNGDWYPWSHDPANFVKAWRHVFNIFKAQNVTNARFVFSMNPSLYLSDSAFLKSVNPYWPGTGYVHAIGTTMINFGGTKTYSVSKFVHRFKIMRKYYPKDLYIAEAQTDEASRVKWLTELRNWLRSSDAGFVLGMNLSQYTSRGQEQMGDKVGNLNWSVTNDPSTKPIIRSIIATTT